MKFILRTELVLCISLCAAVQQASAQTLQRAPWVDEGQGDQYGWVMDHETATAEQNPRVTGYLGGAVASAPRTEHESVTALAASAPPAAQPASQAGAASADLEGLFWLLIMNSTNPADFEAYLQKFPNGVFSHLAQDRLAVLRAQIDFGDDAGRFARDGECDDPRFQGAGMGLSDSSHRGHDAFDCRQLFGSGHVTLRAVDGGDPVGSPVDFGDDSSPWANDGECDDTRFAGDPFYLGITDNDRHIRRDASDCRRLFSEGRIRLK